MYYENQKIENKLATTVIGFAMKIHSQFGPGLLESAYRECLAYELRKAGLKVQTEKAIPLIYDEMNLSRGYRLDILVEDRLVVELKTVEEFTDVHFAQVMTYLKLGDYRLGLLINFNVAHLREGIKRIANNL